jgi:MerR family copper efflux transcriptional regulator
MRIGQLAASTGVSTDTIRYYEKIGLMPKAPRTEGGYREYPGGAANRIRVIRNAVQLGFPLKEIARVMRVRDAGGAPCRQVRDYAHTVVQQIDQKIAELTRERQSLVSIIKDWDDKLLRARPGDRAHLLEDVPIAAPSTGRPSGARRSGSAGTRESPPARSRPRFR